MHGIVERVWSLCYNWLVKFREWCENMVKYEFNRNEFKWGEEFYDIIQKKMNLPEWFGKNADALWDMLTGYIETPCEITLIGFGHEENEYNKSLLNKVLHCFSEVEKKYPDEFKIIYKD